MFVLQWNRSVTTEYMLSKLELLFGIFTGLGIKKNKSFIRVFHFWKKTNYCFDAQSRTGTCLGRQIKKILK